MTHRAELDHSFVEEHVVCETTIELVTGCVIDVRILSGNILIPNSRNVRSNRDAITYANSFNLLADLDHFAGDFMADDHRIVEPRVSVSVDLYVGPTNRTTVYLDEGFAWTWFRNRHFAYLYVLDTIHISGLHRAHNGSSIGGIDGSVTGFIGQSFSIVISSWMIFYGLNMMKYD